MLTIRALSGGETYASRHLSANDYYSENERVIGTWIGQGAELLGLEGEVRMEQFDSIRQGLDPSSGEFLRPRQSADRFNGEGERTSAARSLAAARVRQNGADENRTTSNLVIAQYRHDTSRELDPQIHTHLVAANLTYDGAESRWKALQASEIYEQRGLPYGGLPERPGAFCARIRLSGRGPLRRGPGAWLRNPGCRYSLTSRTVVLIPKKIRPY